MSASSLHVDHPPNSYWWCDGLDSNDGYVLIQVQSEELVQPTPTQPWTSRVKGARVVVPDTCQPITTTVVVEKNLSPASSSNLLSPPTPTTSRISVSAGTLTSPNNGTLRRSTAATSSSSSSSSATPTNPAHAFISKNEDGSFTIPSTLLIPFEKVNPTTMFDLGSLASLNEASVLYLLKERFFMRQIYTYSGTTLISVNPFQELPDLYSVANAQRYQLAGSTAAEAALEGEKPAPSTLPPHLYEIADRAYRDMFHHSRSQSIIIGGESGSGKTEGTKVTLRYFTGLSSGPPHAGGSAGPKPPHVRRRSLIDTSQLEVGHIELKLMESNPLLESLGNAKTVRNNNSSRFGKFIRVYFTSGSEQHATISTADISHYLLERNRIVTQAQGERSYHIMYQLLAGIKDEEKRKELYLPLTSSLDEACSIFHYLNQSGCTSIAGLDDADEFDATWRAMELLGISDGQRQAILKILAGILQLGNVEFEQRGTTTGGAAQDAVLQQTTSHHLTAVTSLLGLPALEAVTSCLLTRLNVIRGETFVVPLEPGQARDVRDSMAKRMYGMVFEWMMQKVNSALKAVNTASASSTQTNFIGLLDLFGFENFARNSMEQFVINYANERVQQFYLERCFKDELRIYNEEGLDKLTDLQFEDNTDRLALIENRMGILSLLNEECVFPKGSDSSFVEKVLTNFKSSSLIRSETKSSIKQESFIVVHFAGEVKYEGVGWLVKNKDAVSNEVIQLFQTCLDSEMKDILNGGESSSSAAALEVVSPTSPPPHSTTPGPTSPAAASSTTARSTPSKFMTLPTSKFSSPSPSPSPSSRSGSTSITSPMSPGAAMASPKSNFIVQKFKDQLTDLMTIIGSTETHFVRCIKPCSELVPSIYTGHMVLKQLKNAGVMDCVRIRAAGYPFRFEFHVFNQMYFSLLRKEDHLNPAFTPKTKSERLLDQTALDPIHYSVGLTRIFLKDTAKQKLDSMNHVFRHRAAVVIQMAWRRLKLHRRIAARVESKRLRLLYLKRVTLVQAYIRGWLGRRAYKKLRFWKTKNVIILQALYRRHRARQTYLPIRDAHREKLRLAAEAEKERLRLEAIEAARIEAERLEAERIRLEEEEKERQRLIAEAEAKAKAEAKAAAAAAAAEAERIRLEEEEKERVRLAALEAARLEAERIRLEEEEKEKQRLLAEAEAKAKAEAEAAAAAAAAAEAERLRLEAEAEKERQRLIAEAEVAAAAAAQAKVEEEERLMKAAEEEQQRLAAEAAAAASELERLRVEEEEKQRQLAAAETERIRLAEEEDARQRKLAEEAAAAVAETERQRLEEEEKQKQIALADAAASAEAERLKLAEEEKQRTLAAAEVEKVRLGEEEAQQKLAIENAAAEQARQKSLEQANVTAKQIVEDAATKQTEEAAESESESKQVKSDEPLKKVDDEAAIAADAAAKKLLLEAELEAERQRQIVEEEILGLEQSEIRLRKESQEHKSPANIATLVPTKDLDMTTGTIPEEESSNETESSTRSGQLEATRLARDQAKARLQAEVDEQKRLEEKITQEKLALAAAAAAVKAPPPVRSANPFSFKPRVPSVTSKTTPAAVTTTTAPNGATTSSAGSTLTTPPSDSTRRGSVAERWLKNAETSAAPSSTTPSSALTSPTSPPTRRPSILDSNPAFAMFRTPVISTDSTSATATTTAGARRPSTLATSAPLSITVSPSNSVSSIATPSPATPASTTPLTSPTSAPSISSPPARRPSVLSSNPAFAAFQGGSAASSTSTTPLSTSSLALPGRTGGGGSVAKLASSLKIPLGGFSGSPRPSVGQSSATMTSISSTTSTTETTTPTPLVTETASAEPPPSLTHVSRAKPRRAHKTAPSASTFKAIPKSTETESITTPAITVTIPESTEPVIVPVDETTKDSEKPPAASRQSSLKTLANFVGGISSSVISNVSSGIGSLWKGATATSSSDTTDTTSATVPPSEAVSTPSTGSETPKRGPPPLVKKASIFASLPGFAVFRTATAAAASTATPTTATTSATATDSTPPVVTRAPSSTSGPDSDSLPSDAPLASPSSSSTPSRPPPPLVRQLTHRSRAKLKGAMHKKHVQAFTTMPTTRARGAEATQPPPLIINDSSVDYSSLSADDPVAAFLQDILPEVTPTSTSAGNVTTPAPTANAVTASNVTAATPTVVVTPSPKSIPPPLPANVSAASPKTIPPPPPPKVVSPLEAHPGPLSPTNSLAAPVSRPMSTSLPNGKPLKLPPPLATMKLVPGAVVSPTAATTPTPTVTTPSTTTTTLSAPGLSRPTSLSATVPNTISPAMSPPARKPPPPPARAPISATSPSTAAASPTSSVGGVGATTSVSSSPVNARTSGAIANLAAGVKMISFGPPPPRVPPPIIQTIPEEGTKQTDNK